MSDIRTLAVVYGTRPEAIKMAPLIMALRREETLDVTTVNVGQHRDSLMLVPSVLRMGDDQKFSISQDGLSLTDISTRAWRTVSRALDRSGCDAVVVQGDTSTALCGALAAAYAHKPVIHLEAGLRTGNPASPFPEEMHRKLISGVAGLHLAPTKTARANLVREGVPPSDVQVVGNTSIDASRIALEAWSPERSAIPADLLVEGRDLIIFTAHRRENWDKMEDFSRLLRRLATRYPQIGFVLPLHPNRLVTDVLRLGTSHLPNVRLLGPMPYDDMMKLLTRARVVVTDSGGLQEEAAALGRPTLVIRDTTERPEGIEAGVAALAGTDVDTIEKLVCTLMDSPEEYRRMACPSTCYGDGRAAERALRAIVDFMAGSR
ncbi:non-hydrolyzing UDP-N-acetylglucosamine 2-epimerase [Streptomyces buecherae]|uniref:UDP-N-acetylglucosamine 2-epimerase (non-hydrolyzing) n=1 Tax=Streptomyces buecherae TaxID=2763006 RepID=A0A7H8NI92_9ACTN|nr:UDP-N-acetylglucosamine 2-epimerase (non-hydrolyzing) [Streptomyces buecherae]QKW48214.1 UDP-N-acetylglucosamine 2-epimerase (non-hydrolyzing) [Streptomyces buecherae]QKW54116.1 UDP-N-acetylglucosamine 2-epimerase (non-hydrolyzing) [Streptomyces buecherae]